MSRRRPDESDRSPSLRDDLQVLADAARRSAAAGGGPETPGERARLLRLAAEVQRRFLPESVPAVPGYEFYAHYLPACEVGGDYYDFIPLPGDRVAVALGDVSGKGIAAALVMAEFSEDARACVVTEDDPARAATVLNARLCETEVGGRFITLSLVVLDPARRRLTLASAGHPPAVVRRADGRVEEVGEGFTGYPLGILPGLDYPLAHVDLGPGDVVVVYSDGVTDARSAREELYDSSDDRRLLRLLARTPGPASAVGRAILQDIREFAAGQPQADDLTLVCFGPTP